MIKTISTILSLLTIVGDATIMILIICAFSKSKIAKKINDFFGAHALGFSFIIVLASILGSLFYSEIARYPPCALCWYQRIFLYPQLIIFLVAILKNYKREAADYAIALSVIGGSFSVYHYYLQTFPAHSIQCILGGGTSSLCSEKFVLNFGYVTIPIMALTAFLMIILFMVNLKRTNGG